MYIFQHIKYVRCPVTFHKGDDELFGRTWKEMHKTSGMSVMRQLKLEALHYMNSTSMHRVAMNA